MDDDENIASAEKEIVDETESIPSKEEDSQSYEVRLRQASEEHSIQEGRIRKH
jgi:hypothetical protein